MFEKAIALATKAHAGQTDKQGAPYILHPLRVMFALRAGAYDVMSQTIGVLHDVVEDTEISLNYIDAALSPVHAEWLDALSRRPDEEYQSFIHRIKDAGPVAVEVKIMDLKDNLGILDPGRGFPTPKRAQRYYKALEILTDRRGR